MYENYVVPVGWQVYSTIKVEASSPEEAVAIAQSCIDRIPISESQEYVDGSYFIDTQGVIAPEGSYGAYASISSVRIDRNGNITH